MGGLATAARAHYSRYLTLGDLQIYIFKHKGRLRAAILERYVLQVDAAGYIFLQGGIGSPALSASSSSRLWISPRRSRLILAS